MIANYYNHARRKRLPVPQTMPTAEQIAGLARDAPARAAYLHRFRSLWLNDAGEDDDDDNDEDDDDDEDAEEDE